jgi:hypothetical protein
VRNAEKRFQQVAAVQPIKSGGADTVRPSERCTQTPTGQDVTAQYQPRRRDEPMRVITADA